MKDKKRGKRKGIFFLFLLIYFIIIIFIVIEREKVWV